MKHLVATTLLGVCVAFTQVALAQEPSPNAYPSSITAEEPMPTGNAPSPVVAEPAATTTPTPETTSAPTTVAPTAPAASTVAAPAAAKAVDPRLGTPTAAELADAYEIGPEDVLDISVWKNPELSRTVPVRPDGKVSLPLVNDIQAAGLTPIDLRDQVTARLSEYLPSPEVSVIVREVHSRRVSVVGAVKTPGRYELKSPMTVLEVIALAQGFTDFATRDRIVVLRREGEKTIRIPFNYRKIADSAGQENFLVRPGDIVMVP